MESTSIRPREELEKLLHEISKTLEFKDAHLELPSDDNKLQLIEFLKEYGYKDETMSKCLGSDFGDDLHELWLQRLKQPLSLILVSNSGEIIGASTMTVIQKGLHPVTQGKTMDNEKLKKIFGILTYKNEDLNVFKRYGVDKAIRIILLCVHRANRRQGIAKKLMQATLMYCKDVGLKPVCLYAEGTSKYSQHIFEQFDFETLYSVKYADYKYNGEVVFQDTGENDSVAIFVKQL